MNSRERLYLQLSNKTTGFSFAATMLLLVRLCSLLILHEQLHHQSARMLFLVVLPKSRHLRHLIESLLNQVIMT